MTKNEMVGLLGMAMIAGSIGWMAGPAWGVCLAGLSLFCYSLRESIGDAIGRL